MDNSACLPLFWCLSLLIYVAHDHDTGPVVGRGAGGQGERDVGRGGFCDAGWGGKDGARQAETLWEVGSEYGESGFKAMGSVGRC
jgi:hypothetical protein